jgi:TetR/AcrR family transcriptional regulator, cholesterol catabolism regulator
MEIKNRIIEGAAELFRTYGIRSVTMDSLASHLGMSKRTIYEVFADKDELLVSVLKWMSDKQNDLVVRIMEDSENAIQAIFSLLEFSMEHFQDMNPVFHNDLRKYHYMVLINRPDKSGLPDYKANIQIIERGIKEKLFRKEINPDIVNRCLFSLGRAAVDFDLFPSEEFPRREVVMNGFINYLKGISTPLGIELINKLEAKFLK